jgi:hypothetical protein
MFNQQKQQNQLKIGDLVVVGSCIDGVFVQAKYGVRVVVAGLREEIGPIGVAGIKVDLLWSGGTKSFVYLHDEGKYWKRAENFN